MRSLTLIILLLKQFDKVLITPVLQSRFLNWLSLDDRPEKLRFFLLEASPDRPEVPLHQFFDLPKIIAFLKILLLYFFHHLEVLLVDPLPGVFNGKGNAHPAVEEDELEEEEDGEDSVLDLAWFQI